MGTGTKAHTIQGGESVYPRRVAGVGLDRTPRATERAQRLREAQNRPDPGFANRGESRTGERPDVAGSGERGKEQPRVADRGERAHPPCTLRGAYWARGLSPLRTL